MNLLNFLIFFVILLVPLHGQIKPDMDKSFLVFSGGGATFNGSEYLTENWGLGYNFSMEVGYSFSPLFSLTFFQIQYSRFGLDKEKFLGNYHADIINADIHGWDVHSLGFWSKMNFKFFEKPESFFPYLWLGFGFMGLTREQGTITGKDTILTLYSSTVIYLSLDAGIGVQYYLSDHLSINISASYIGGTGFMPPEYIRDVSYCTLNMGILVYPGKVCILPSIPGL